MIHNAIAGTNPSTDMWVHFKTIDHALARASGVYGDSIKLTNLDKERLKALIELLQTGLPPEKQEVLSKDPWSNLQFEEPSYNLALGVRNRIKSNKAFEEWKTKSSHSFDSKLRNLINHLEEFINNPPMFLTANDIKPEEFEVLREIVQTFLFDAELALY